MESAPIEDRDLGSINTSDFNGFVDRDFRGGCIGSCLKKDQISRLGRINRRLNIVAGRQGNRFRLIVYSLFRHDLIPFFSLCYTDREPTMPASSVSPQNSPDAKSI
jgi:hypothetical protein